MTAIRGAIAVAFMVGAFVLAFHRVALPHSWYPPECCSDQDCAPMPESQRPTPLPGGAWMLVTGEVVPRTKVRWSPDAAFHLCKLPWEPHTTFCLFVPPVGS